MTSKILRKLSPMLGLSLVMLSGCIKSVCESNSDCPSDKRCDKTTNRCAPACATDGDCLAGNFCNLATNLCVAGCRSSSECPSENACVNHECWSVNSSTPQTDGGPKDVGPADGGTEDGGTVNGAPDAGGPLACSCLRAPHACLVDINPASSTAGTSVCEPSDPPRATLLFFGNVGCSHCQSILGQLLEIQSQLRKEGFDPTMAFVQLKTYDYTAKTDIVASTFPEHQGPVLQDTDSGNMWDAYKADWYEVKIIDTHGCLSAFFASPETMSMISGGRLLTSGTQVKEAWISAMGNECHALVDAGVAPPSGL
jgi:hypothetical protein